MKLQTVWSRHRATLLQIAIALMTLVAVLKLGDEFRRLLWESGRTGAIDLKLRYKEVHAWFAGEPVYRVILTAVYPPQSYTVLWFLLGWLPLSGARWLWAITSLVMLVWLSRLTVQASTATNALESTFVALLPLSMIATGVTIGNGQLILHILPCLLTSIALFCQNDRWQKDLWQGNLWQRNLWQKDLLAAILFGIALVSPIITPPFLWIVAFVTKRLRPLLWVSLGYLAATVFALLFQFSNLSLIWTVARPQPGLPTGLVLGESYANLHTWLFNLGINVFHLSGRDPRIVGSMAISSLLVFLGLGLWIYWQRDRDLWILLGITAIVARLWTYHRIYNNLLILLPMIALFRILKHHPSMQQRSLAGILFALTWFGMLLPASLQLYPGPLNWLATIGHPVVWLAVLFFLLNSAHDTLYANET